MNVAQTNLNPNVESDPGYGQILKILLRQRLWLLGGLISAMAIAAGYSMMQKPVYTSLMQLLVEPNYQGKPQSSDQQLQSEFSDSSVVVDNATQVNLLRSTGLLKRAMRLIQKDFPKLNPDNPNSVAEFRGAIEVQQISQRVGKETVQTKLFQITYKANDPVEAQVALDALRQVYLDYNLEQQKQRLERGLAFVNEQLPQIKKNVDDAEAALEKFRTNQELIDPELQAKAQVESLIAIQRQQETNLAQIQELRSRFASLQNQVAMSPQQAMLASRLSQSNRYQSLLNEIQKSELGLEQQRLRFKDGTAFVEQAQEQRQRQLGLLQTEVRRILGGGAASGEALLSQGQLGGLDLTLIGQYVEAQVALSSAQARYVSLAGTEQQIRNELKRFPQLLAEYGRLQPEIALNRDTLKQLLKAQQEIGLEIARGGFDWQIVEEPQIGAVSGGGLLQNLMIGAVVGLMLGGAAAFARESADDAVHSSDDLEKQVAVPLLGMVPELVLDEESNPVLNLPFGKGEVRTPAFEQVIYWQPFRESMDLLYQNIQLLGAVDSLKSIVVTSALAGEGKSTLILGLATSAARLHQRVLLIDADLRRPSLHKLLNLPNDRGLSTLLTSDASIPKLVDEFDSDARSNISVLTSGPTPSDPAKLLSSQRMREVIAAFEASYDLVLLDAPPVLGMVDAILAASCCRGVVLVGRIDQVTRSELTQATAMLSKLNVIGVVANGAKRPTRSDNPYQTRV
jgi:capsular exopolysaccharide synthesis family protein